MNIVNRDCDRCSQPASMTNQIFCSNEDCCYHESNKCSGCGNPSWYNSEDGKYYCACICDTAVCACNCCGLVRDSICEGFSY